MHLSHCVLGQDPSPTCFLLVVRGPGGTDGTAASPSASLPHGSCSYNVANHIRVCGLMGELLNIVYNALDSSGFVKYATSRGHLAYLITVIQLKIHGFTTILFYI